MEGVGSICEKGILKYNFLFSDRNFLIMSDTQARNMKFMLDEIVKFFKIRCIFGIRKPIYLVVYFILRNFQFVTDDDTLV